MGPLVLILPSWHILAGAVWRPIGVKPTYRTISWYKKMDLVAEHIHVLAQVCRDSITNALELLQVCTKESVLCE